MHTITFYPLGNAECCLITLANGRDLLFDFADMRDASNTWDLRIDLSQTLREYLVAKGKDSVDVLAFTHGDEDHVRRASEFFHLRHAVKYQGLGRIHISELWVPAEFILESRNDLPDDAAILQAEARHRLKEGKGIRVFSRPELLADWITDQGLTLDSRRDLLTNAGEIVPGYTLEEDGVEFFVHSPFAMRVDGGLVDRNDSSLVMQAVFEVESEMTKMLITGDITHEIWTDIIEVTKAHNRPERLEWHILDVPHHCSYKAIGSDKGKGATEPVPSVKWLLEDQAQKGALCVVSSVPIPTADTTQPPHREAASYYKDCIANVAGQFRVTMEHPSESKPEPMVVTISGDGATLNKKSAAFGVAGVIASKAPRAGHDA